MKKYNIAIVGATGLVGRTFLEVLSEMNFPINDLKLFASSKSAGSYLRYNEKDYEVEELNEHSFDSDIDIALFSAGGAISKKYAPIARDKGIIVIDNSSAFRMSDDASLVVPEINLDDVYEKSKIIANPNCSTIQSVIPLKALNDKFGLKRVCFTTYQAVSGSGLKGINDLERCKKGEVNQFYPYDIANTCIPEIDEFLESGYTKEEMKMVNETRKILHLPHLPVSATCIRVPVVSCHGVVIQAELNRDFTLDEVRDAIKNQEGLVLYDDIRQHIYPNSIIAKGQDKVFVGRIRYDLAHENSVLLYCVADNIRKGAASNAVQIARQIDIKKCKKL